VWVDNEEVVCANIGDSRATMWDGSKIIPLSHDHKPTDENERKRIEASEHKVDENGRIDGNLAVCRGLGDFMFKEYKIDEPEYDYKAQAITCDADVITYKRTKKEQYFMLACDGIWEVLDNEKCIETVNEMFKEHSKMY